MKDDEPLFIDFAEVEGVPATLAEPGEAEIVDNYRVDNLYTNPFGRGDGKYFTVVSSDDTDVPNSVEAEHPWPIRNKIKTTLTFLKAGDGYIKDVSFKRFKYYKKGWAEQDEQIVFSFRFFKELIGFLQSLDKLNLNDINERRIPLGNSPSLDPETVKQFNNVMSTAEGQALMVEAIGSGNITTMDIVNIGYRKAQLEVFEKLMTDDVFIETYRTEHDIKKAGIEPIWQHFFEMNPWIFGYGLNFIFNQPLEGKKLEQVIQGSDVSQSGKRADAVLKTTGAVNSLCLVELKTHKTALLKKDAYRADCWQASDELGGGIAQAQKTTQKTLENLSTELNGKDDEGNPTGEIVYSYQPKSYLIVGCLSEFVTEHGINKEKFASFELLRKNMTSPEVITFDELLERARFIVSNSKKD